MKKTYLQPTIADDMLLSDEELMVTASAEGGFTIENGGGTTGSGITEGDSRRHNVWDDEEDF